MAKMQDDELKSIIQAEIANAVGASDTELSSDRTDGWDSYLREPYGNEMEGRSSVVSSDVQDTVEWIMPSLLRIFSSGDAAVEFVPNGAEDEERAEQATDYANYVWERDNPGFLNFHTWFKEALIAKLGTVKVYWEVKDQWKKERYDGLDDDAYALIVDSPDCEIVEHTEYPSDQPPSLEEMGEPAQNPMEEMGAQMPQMPGMDGMAPPQMTGLPMVQPPPQMLHDVVIRMKTSAGKICIEPVPADEVLFSKDAKDVQHCRYFAHKTKKTISDLIEQYPDKRETIEALSSDDPSSRQNTEGISRSTVGEDTVGSDQTAAINKAMREVWVVESYVKVDWDGDGIAEMRKVTTVGQNLVIDNEEWDGPRPFACVCPVLMPHRLVGLSIPDLIKDIQLIKTAILRQFLDGLYIANNPRYEVDVDRIEDPAEVMTSKPGGIVRKHGDAPAMMPVMTSPIADQALLGLNYIDQLRENRTGVSPRTQGLGADTLHDTKGGQELLFDAAKMRVELIARVFAEGVKDAFKLILWNANKYQDKARTVRLRNKWVSLDPREWADEYDMTVNVGLGHNDQQRDIMALTAIGNYQVQAIQFQGGANGPLVTLENLHNTATQLVKAVGLKAPERYFTDPKTMPPQPAKPDPEMMKIQAQMQMKQQEMQGKAQIDTQRAQQDFQLEQAKMQQQAQIETLQAQADIETNQQKAAADLQIAREKHQMDMQMKMIEVQALERKNQIESENARMKAKMDARMAVSSYRMKRKSGKAIQ